MQTSTAQRRGLFVTGTDTGVGKTVVSAALMVRYHAARPRYWKPVQTGIEEDDDTATVVELASPSPVQVLDAGERLERPLSPHLSARLADRRIEPESLIDLWHGEQADSWVVEGAGGVLVPLNESQLLTDLMAMVGLPVLIAARSGLGTINHTLMTLEALRSRSLRPAGVVLVGEPNRENRKAIEHYGQAPVVGELPRLEPLTPASLQQWASESFDRLNVLEKYFVG